MTGRRLQAATDLAVGAGLLAYYLKTGAYEALPLGMAFLGLGVWHALGVLTERAVRVTVVHERDDPRLSPPWLN